MKNYDESVEINHNLNWSYIPDHTYRILIIGGSGSDKTIVLLNVVKNQRLDIDKVYLYLKVPLLYNLRGKVGNKKLRNPKAFIDYSQKTDDVYENVGDYTPTKKRRVLTVFDDTIADM